MRTLVDSLKSIVKSNLPSTSCFRKSPSLLCRSLVLIIISISVIPLMPLAGWTQPPSYEGELSEGQRLVKEFGELTGNPNSSREAILKKAFEVSQSQQAKQILKGSQKGLGKIYNDIVYVGNNSIVSKLINKAKAKLKAQGVPQSVLDHITSIRNKASIDSGSAPMDLDVGINSQGNKALEARLLKDLGGIKGVKTFEGALQTALESSLTEIAAEAGVTGINTGNMGIKGTTPWSADSYGQSGILTGDSPDAGHAGQTADVTKTKVDEQEDLVKSGKRSQESAWQEAARGTLKDRPKMENAFNEIYTQTGKRAGWTNEQARVWDLLEQLTNEGIPPAEIHRINAEIKKLTGKDVFGACRQLVDTIEAAWKLAPRLKLTPGQFIEVLISNKDGSQRRVLIDDQIKMRSQGEPDWKSYEILRDIIAKVRGNQFINSMLATETGKGLLKHASMVAPMALMNIFVKYETGQMNDARDLAGAVLEVLPAANGFILAYTGDKSLLDKEVLNAWLMEGFFWGLVIACPACAPVLIAGAVGNMAWSLAEFKTGSVTLQNYHSGLVDLFVYNGEFPDGKFARLVLPGNKVIEGSGLRPFLFETKAVTIRIAVPDWGVIINNLSEKSEEVYKKYYLAKDPAVAQFTDASAQLEKNAGCTANSTEKYCRVYDLIQRKLENRRQEVIDAVMIPHLISLAEAKRATLDATDDLSGKINDLQKELHDLRGRPLGISLKVEIDKKAEELASATTDTKESKTLTKGGYWQTAFSAYEKIVALTKDLKSKIQEETGFEQPSLLQFDWSGNYDQDLLRAVQSRTGFFLDIAKIKKDISDIKRGTPDLNDTVDKQAFEILNRVAFNWRQGFDQSNTSGPTGLTNIEEIERRGNEFDPQHRQGSNFFTEYEEALKKVRALYEKKEDFQTQLEKGAKIIPADPALMMGKGTEMELVFTDEGLKKDLVAKAFTFKWSASPQGTFSPNDYDQKVTFTAPDPGSVTITVRVERSVPKEERINGSLAITLPVKVPENFVRLELIPATLKPEEKGKADTTLDQLRFIDKLKYKWSGTNCQVEDVDRLSTSVIAPKTGQATVTVELFIKDAEGQWVSLITKQVSFSVDGKPGDKPKDDKPKDDKPGTGDPKDGQKPPPQVQPGAYTQPPGTQPSGQAGVQGGASGQAGITSGVSGQAGVQGGTTGQAGTTPSVSGQTGVLSGTSGQAGTTPGVSGQTGLTSGVSTGTGIGLTSTPPACTYDYSAWGKCDQVAKKWTRSVIAKKPAGCVETAKPVLEEGCTPPPTEEEKRNRYLNCLCRCSSGWGGHIGVWYDPENKTKPECKSSGPCIGGIGALGCSSRHYFAAPNDCAKGCYEGVYGKGTYNEKIADKIRRDENKKFKEPLKLKINEKCPITAQLGDIITLTASFEGGIPPHKFSWSGNGQAKENTFTFANSRQPGPHPISVSVTDDEGETSTASCTVVVEALTVKIELLDKEKKIPIGESRNFSGTVMAGDKPARGEFYFLWQPHPEVLFSPFEKTGGNVSGTTAKFSKLGKFKVWVIAHTYKGNVKTTIGESEQIEIEVSKPEIKLEFQPKTPKVGQEVKLTVTEKPKMDDKTIAFWWEISGNTLNPGPLKGDREYTFKPKDTKPVTVTVHGKARDGGDDLGGDKATITAQEYTVSLSEPKYMGSKPKIWKCDTQLGRAANCGLVEVTTELAVFHDIFIKASVTPEPDKPPLRYAWAIDPSGICGIPGGGQDLKINCSQTGSYTVKATVRDSQDVVLGTAQTSVSITVSQDDLNKGKGPLVTLTADKASLKTGETAVIKATVQGGKAPYTYRWGEGVEGKAETARFSPKKSGAQKITAEVTDAAGKKASADLSVKVEPSKLEVAIAPDKPTLKLGEKALIQAKTKGGEPPITYQWGAGVEGKDDVARFVADKTGLHKVSLAVSDKAGQKASASVDLNVEAPKLEVAIAPDKPTLKLGEKAVIQAKVKGGEPPITYQWGAGVEGKDDVARFVADKTGLHKISLDVSDKAGQKASASIDLKVEAPKLDVAIAPDKPTLKVGEKAVIQAKVKGGEPPFTYQWGAGVEGKDDIARFVADKPGVHKVSLDVSDKAGQKASASVDLKVEAPKLEVALTPDKPTLRVGETGTIQAKVKGGMPDYTYQWSSFVTGKGETAAFTPSKTGLYKVWLEVRDKMGGKATASLDWKVEAGREGQTPQTTGQPVAGPAGPSTAITSTVLASGMPTSSTPGSTTLPTLVIEPKNLSISSGKSLDIKVFTVQKGRKVADVTDQCTLQVSTGSGIRIDRSGRITLEKTARPGAVEPVLATLRHASGATLRADGIIRIEGAATLSSGGYNPNTDPGKSSTVKPEDLDKVKKIGTDFQTGQWKPLETKEQKIKEQPAGQAQSPGYLSSSTTTALTTVPPGSTSTPTTVPSGGTTTPATVPPGGTSTPTTVRPGGTTTPTTAKPTTIKPTTTITGATPQNLTDVTVDRRDVTITVWDHGAEDGDIITIYMNGNVLKKNLKLTTKKQSFPVKLTGGQNRFEVEAVNEGSTPPNTATVEISNVTKGKPNQVYERKTGQRASMNLTAP